MLAERKAWPNTELLIVFRLYCRTPFGRLHQRNPEIVQLATLIGRTPGAVAMKACNFASLDRQHQARGIKALRNASRADRELWGAFLEDSEAVAQEAEAVYGALTGKDIEEYIPELAHTEKATGRRHRARQRVFLDQLKAPDGATEKDIVAKVRWVQSFFRAAVL
jgi:putative restriction endonuclease